MPRPYTMFALLLAPLAVAAQDAPRFEVASVRPSADQGSQTLNVGLSVSGSQVRINYMSLRDHIGIAYGVRIDQVTGPDWISSTRFDIAAKLPDGASVEQVNEMLQTLLAERFELRIHRETKEFPVYALTTIEGAGQLQPVTEEPGAIATPAVTVAASGSAAGVTLDMGGGSSFTLSNNRIEIRRMSVPDMANVLGRFMDRPVVDATGLSGRYDVTIPLSPEDYTAMLIRSAIGAGMQLPPQALRLLETASGDPLSNGLRSYGLAFEARRMPLDVIVVDSALRTPTEN